MTIENQNIFYTCIPCTFFSVKNFFQKMTKTIQETIKTIFLKILTLFGQWNRGPLLILNRLRNLSASFGRARAVLLVMPRWGILMQLSPLSSAPIKNLARFLQTLKVKREIRAKLKNFNLLGPHLLLFFVDFFLTFFCTLDFSRFA